MRSKTRLCRIAAHVVLVLTVCSMTLAQQPEARRRILQPVDDSQTVTLRGNTHPLARAEFDAGAAPDAQPISRMMMLLSRTPEQQAALDQFVEDQQNPSSPNYRHWLTPAEIGSRFGSNDADVQTVVSWLQQQGFAVEGVTAGKSVIVFSGSAGQVRQAFRTSMHKYVVNGQEHWANASDPKIPAALAQAVKGLVSLNNFPRKPQSHKFGVFSRDKNGEVTPEFTVTDSAGGKHYALGPADFSTIYNTKPLLQAGNNGAGQTIAIVGRTNINLQDVTDFRNLFGLGAGNTSVVVDGVDPGFVDGDELESLLDVQWANAVAPGANVVFVTAADTASSSGLDLAAIHIIENNLAGVMSESYGACEANLGSAGNAFYQMLWQQAAAQGITVVVSTGDNGSAGCDNQNDPNVHTAAKGLGVNGLASTSYNVAVGGTDFDDAGTQTTYFNATNDATTRGSAKSYIPERTWNETCAAMATAGNTGVCPAMPTSGTPPDSLNLWAGSGGASNCASSNSGSCQGRPKPAWQTGTGVPNDGVRDLPDISFFSAVSSDSRSFYVVCQADGLPSGYPSCQPGSSIYFMGVGGTSAAAPSFAGIVALAQQKAGTRLGNINYLLYSIAAKPGASCTSSATSASGCVFHDTVKGNISVPCTPGSPSCSATSGTATGVLIKSGQPAFTATAGYDLATGLGSVDVTNLANAIVTALGHFTPTTTSLTLNGATTPITANHGDPVNVAVSVSPSESTGQVSLIGVNGITESRTLNSGAASWTTPLLPGGNYQLKAHYAGDGTHGSSDSNPISLTISPEASQVFLNFITWDVNGHFQTATGNSAPYGSPYVLRVDVADTSATVSSTSGVNSKCSTGGASCPTGNVTVTANGNPLDGGTFGLNSAGYTEDQTIQLPAGTYTLAAAYAGDPSYNASTASKPFTISKGATAITLYRGSQPPYEYGRSFEIEADLTTTSSGVAPTGNNITFYDNGTATSIIYPSNTPHAGGASGYAGVMRRGEYIPPSVGTHSLSAQFSGDANYDASQSPTVDITVDKATTRISGGASPDVATPTLAVVLSATVETDSNMNQPTGTVTFYDNGTPISGTVTYGGRPGTPYITTNLTAQLSTTFAQTGSHSISASYSGDDNYKPVTKNLGTLTVSSKLPTSLSTISSSMTPALKAYSTTLSVSISIPPKNGLPDVTGTVVFSDNGQPITGAVTYQKSFNGYGSYTLTATLPYSFSASGTHSITAAYSGDTNYAASTSSTPLSLSVVDKLPTSIALPLSLSVQVNAGTNLQANISSNASNTVPVMTGTVTFVDGGATISGNVTLQNQSGSMIASMPYTFTTAGVHNITARYSGDTYYQASESTVYPLQVLGPIGLFVDPLQSSLTTAGGTGHPYVYVQNNTANSANVTLACTSDSPKGTCYFSPSTLTLAPGAGQSPTLSFSVPAVYASAAPSKTRPFTMPIIFAGMLAGLCFTGRRKSRLAVGLFVLCFILALTSCGGGGTVTTPGGGGPRVTNPSTYHFTITATSGTMTDSRVLTVTLQ